MIKNDITRLEYKIDDKVYQFLCDPNSPIQHVKEALLQFACYATQIGNSASNPMPLNEESKQEIKKEAE